MWRAYFSSAVVQARGAESALQLGPHIPPHKKKTLRVGVGGGDKSRKALEPDVTRVHAQKRCA